MAQRRTNKVIKRPLLQITWLDHHANGAWTDSIDHTPAICHSVGWLIKEDRKAITLAASYTEENASVGNTQYIIKNCITERKKLNV
jgi:hypothetical protein